VAEPSLHLPLHYTTLHALHLHRLLHALPASQHHFLPRAERSVTSIHFEKELVPDPSPAFSSSTLPILFTDYLVLGVPAGFIHGSLPSLQFRPVQSVNFVPEPLPALSPSIKPGHFSLTASCSARVQIHSPQPAESVQFRPVQSVNFEPELSPALRPTTVPTLHCAKCSLCHPASFTAACRDDREVQCSE